MSNVLGAIIFELRKQKQLTQDQFGASLGITGPAVFKFEKGQVRPSLDLWMKIATEAEIPERRAILLWLQAKLPPKFRHYIEPDQSNSSWGKRVARDGNVDYASFDDREAIRTAMSKDRKLPRALKDLMADDELWELFKPNGHEINMLRDIFSPMGKGSKARYAEALRLIREFTHSF